jgi:hypothetical protein
LAERGDDFNHYVRREHIDLSIIEGRPVVALCGVRWVVELAVGSSGRANDPDLPICPECELFHGALDSQGSEVEEGEVIVR